MKKIVVCTLLLFLSLKLSALQADSGAELPEGKEFGFSLAPVYTFLNGQSYEMVLQLAGDPGDYLSKLIWDLDAIHMVGGKASLNFKDRLFVNFALAKALTEDSGDMYDYDWLYTEYEGKNPDLTTWTNKSVSDISLISSYQMDFNLSYKAFHTRVDSFHGLIGYKKIFWSWTDSLTSIDYPYEYKDYSSLLETNGIDYEVDYRIPYCGVAYSRSGDTVEAGLTLLYSFLVNAETVDHHKYVGSSEEKYFYDSFQYGNYLGLSVYTRIVLQRPFSLSITYDWDQIFETQGNATIVNELGERGYSPNSVAMSYTASSLALSLEYNY